MVWEALRAGKEDFRKTEADSPDQAGW
jgi:hypothetical protein